MKRKLFFLLALMLGFVSSVKAQETPTNDGIYYIYNEEYGLFLTRGNNWGTQAIATPVGLPWKIAVDGGKYTLRMYDITVAGGTNGFGSDAYTDNVSPIQFTPNGNASAGYTLQNGSNYITCPAIAGGVVSLSGTASNWKFLTQAQYNAVLAAKVTTQESNIATLKSITIPDGKTLNDVVTDVDNWRVSPTVNDGVPTSSTWTASSFASPDWRGAATNWGDYGTEMYQVSHGHYTRTITGLAKGIYKVSIRGMKRMANNANCSTMGDAGYPISDAYMSANGYIIRFKAWYENRVSATNPNSPAEFVSIVNNGGYTTEGFAYVDDDGELVLDVSTESYWGGVWFLFNGISYTYYDNSVSDDDINALIETIPSHVSEAHAEAMDAAKTTLLSEKTIANYNALSAAIDAAQTSANEYAIIDAGVVPTNTTEGWAKSTTNGTLACNTWSPEGTTDGSGMTTPFVQDWVGAGTPLAGGNAGGKLYYSFTDLTPGETYVVTARVRVFNESASGVTGATYYVGANSKALNETFSSPCVGAYASKGRFAVLSCAGTVDSNGDLKFGIELDEDSPINWIAIKDVTIVAGTGDVPTAISLNKVSTALTTGGLDALTATITPATADDKTVLWSSSDESVATVSGGNIVAWKAGTATITATAYAGDDVTATCTVTVADAAAPSYYSTSIVDGTDYYIYNAATGKFLGGANAWGTQASMIKHGIPFTVAISEGKYTLDSHTYNSETDHFFNGTYVDGSTTDLYITALSDGKYSISTADGSAFVTVQAGSTTVANNAADATSKLAQWYFLSKADRDKMLPNATSLNPVDVTYYIKEADISRNLRVSYGESGWTNIHYGEDKNQDNSNYNAQEWNASVDVYQTIGNIPNGTYKVRMQGFSSGTGVKLYANGEKVSVNGKPSEINTQSGAAAQFSAGNYWNEVEVSVTDNTLKIGLEGDCTSAKWLCYDNFELYCTELADIPVDFGASGFATFACDDPVTLPDDESIKGYTASISGKTITFNKITDKVVPANTGVMLSGKAGEMMFLPVAADDAPKSSDFIRGTGDVLGADDDNYYFAIKKSASDLTFGTFNPTSVVIATNKAYFTIAKNAIGNARLVISFDEEDPTAINAIEAAEAEAEGLKDGKYLIDGKIVIVKNGVKYSANGQILK